MDADSHLAQLLEAYSNITFRCLRMEQYSADQSLYMALQNKIYRQLKVIDPLLSHPRFKHGSEWPETTPTHRLLILIGDGSFAHNSRGHLPTPSGQRIFDELRMLGEIVLWINEYRTSLCCSLCHSQMEQATILTRSSRDRLSNPPPEEVQFDEDAELRCKQSCWKKTNYQSQQPLQGISMLARLPGNQ